MNKAELIRTISKITGISQKVVAEVLEAFQHTIMKGVKEQGTVKLIGFGTWNRHLRKACVKKNPRTGEPLEIGESTTTIFKVGKTFKELLNQ